MEGKTEGKELFHGLHHPDPLCSETSGVETQSSGWTS